MKKRRINILIILVLAMLLLIVPRTQWGSNFLCYAASYGDEKLVKALLLLGGDPNKGDLNGETAL